MDIPQGGVLYFRQNENTKDTVSDGRGDECGGHVVRFYISSAGILIR